MRDSLDSSKPPYDLTESSRDPATASGTYLNPILDADFPDPAVILAPDG